jgi:pyruvate formate lyase activating enzyme
MNIYGFQKTTLLDFPGKVACTVFLGGCNFRCPFCHNSSLVFSSEFPDPVDMDEFFGYIRKRKGILDGVCITGGEPLLLKETLDFLKQIKDEGLSVKLDTNGSFPERLETAVREGLVDYVAMDIKSSRKNYGKAVGIADYDTASVEKSVSFLLEKTVPFEFRTTAVRGIHEKLDFVDIASWIQGADRYYLQSFVKSYRILDKEADLSAFTREEMDEFAEIVAGTVGKVEIRGI